MEIISNELLNTHPAWRTATLPLLDNGEGERPTSPVSPPLFSLLLAPPMGPHPTSPRDTAQGSHDNPGQPKRGCAHSTRPQLPASHIHTNSRASEPPRCAVGDPFVPALITPDMVGNAVTLHPTSSPHEEQNNGQPSSLSACPTTMGPPRIRGDMEVTGDTTPRLRIENK